MDCARLGQRSGTSQSNMAAAEMCAKQTKKQGKSRTWTETELKYFAIVLTDEKYEYGHKLDSLALKKSANKSVFEDVKKALMELMSTEEFKAENQQEMKSKQKDLSPLDICTEKLRVKFKWMKEHWRKYTDRVKKGSGKSPVIEPAWYKIINPLFSDTHGNLEVASRASDVLSDDSNDSHISDSEDKEGAKVSASTDSSYHEDDNESDLLETSDSGTGGSVKRKLVKKKLEAKPYDRKKRLRSQTQAINEIAKSFSSLGESQQKRSELVLQAERERHDDFLKFQREQAELNRQHELRMLEIIMKFSNVQPQGMNQHDATHVQPFQPHAHMVPPQYAQYSSVAYGHKLPPHMQVKNTCFDILATRQYLECTK